MIVAGATTVAKMMNLFKNCIYLTRNDIMSPAPLIHHFNILSTLHLQVVPPSMAPEGLLLSTVYILVAPILCLPILNHSRRGEELHSFHQQDYITILFIILSLTLEIYKKH